MRHLTNKEFAKLFPHLLQEDPILTAAEWSRRLVKILEEEKRGENTVREEIKAKLTPAQTHAVEKANKFGWEIAGYFTKTQTVRLAARGGKEMKIDINGNRVK